MTRFELSDVLLALPTGAAALTRAVLAEAERRKVRVHLVGGPVRDLLLERPIRDVDLLVEGHDELGAEVLAQAAAPADGKVTPHDRFGTVTLSAAGAGIDLASARRESYASSGALPSVEPGTLEEDLRRRDFSVNALALPLTTAARPVGGSGSAGKVEVIDLEGGLADLAERRLRVLHARSFHDDPTRALRAARLGPRLGFALARGSRAALRNALRDGAFGAVSGDRLRREIEKLFAEAPLGLRPHEALRCLADWHVLPALEPGLELPRESVVPLRRLGRALAAPPWRGPRLRPWAAGLCTWLAPFPPGLRRRTLRRFSVRGELATRVVAFPSERQKWLAALTRARGRGAVDAVLAGIDEERLLALHAASPAAIQRRIVRWAAEDRTRRSPVSGNDLLELGLSGPAVGRALARIRAAYLDGALANREEGMALARELGRQRRSSRRSRAGARRSGGKGT